MRRSGSSSCMLRSRESLSAADLDESQNMNLSVTMITSKRLPTYSVERYYMLSEIEQAAQSVMFLNDNYSEEVHMQDGNKLEINNGNGNARKYNAYDIYDNASNPSNFDEKNRMCQLKKENQHVILYLLWQPNMYHSTNALSTMIELNIEKVLHIFGEKLYSDSSPQDKSDSNTSSSTMSKNVEHTTNAPFKTKIHLAIDRISPPVRFNSHDNTKNRSDEMIANGLDAPYIELNDTKNVPLQQENNTKQCDEKLCNSEYNQKFNDDEDNSFQSSAESHHAVEIKVVESLARALAVSKTIRSVIEGVTIGVTTEVRAAPALECVLKSLVYGSKERRHLVLQGQRLNHDFKIDKNSNNPIKYQDISKSPIHIVSQSLDDMIGLDATRETDAVQDIIQSLTSAEWNGNGDFKSFARRAQHAWKKEYGLDMFDDETVASDDRSDMYDSHIEDVSSAMVMAFLFCVIAWFWVQYGDLVNEYFKLFR